MTTHPEIQHIPSMMIDTVGGEGQQQRDSPSEVSSMQDNSVVIKHLLAKQQARQQEKKRRYSTADVSARPEHHEQQEDVPYPPPPPPALRLDTLHGRQKEMCLLQESYDRVASTGRSEAFLVKGKSGSGKSQLVDKSLRLHVSTYGGGLYASGKYDQMLKNGDPYSSALASALEDVCALLRSVEQESSSSSEGHTTHAEITSSTTSASERIRSALEPEDLRVLQQWIPSLRYVVPDGCRNSTTTPSAATTIATTTTDIATSTTATATATSTTTPIDSDDVIDPETTDAAEGVNGIFGSTATTTTLGVDQHHQHQHHDALMVGSSSTTTMTSLPRFKTLLQILVRCMASPAHPLVLFLDDLQWADPASLQVLQALLTDSQSHHTLFLCTIREEELDDCCDKSSFLQEWVSSSTTTNTAVNLAEAGASATSNDESSWRSAKPSTALIPTTMMRIGNLQVPTLNQLLLHALDLQQQQQQQPQSSSSSNNGGTTTPPPTNSCTSTLKLAQVLYKKTGGRPYCVVTFLHCLVAESMLVYDHADSDHEDNNNNKNDGGRWTWDLERIQALTDVSDSVVPVLMRRVERMPLDTTWTLQVASCLGHDFDGMLLKEYMIREFLRQEQERDRGDTLEQERDARRTTAAPTAAEHRFQVAISAALQSGLMEAAGGIHQYKFTHDTIQQCFYDLMEPTEQAQRHWDLGQQMKGEQKKQRPWEKKTQSKELIGTDSLQQQQHSQRMFFLMVDQLNRGAKAIPTLKDRKELITLNMETGRRALSVSAFAVAANVLRSAHELLVNTDEIQKWGDDDYDMSLKVCTALAEYEGLSGNFTESHVMTSEIVEHAQSFEDKLPAYSIELDGLSARGRFREGFDLGLPLLEQLGEPFPAQPKIRHILGDMIRVSLRLSRSRSAEKLLTLPKMTDKTKLESMKLMKRLCSFAMFLDEANFAALFSMRMLRRTLSDGICVPSAYAIAVWSVTQATLGKTNAAYRYGQVALGVLKRLHAQDSCPAVVAMVYGGGLHWKMPVGEMIPIFHRASVAGFRTGDIADGFISAYSAVNAHFYINASLVVKERTLRETVARMREFNQDSARLVALPLLQMMQNFMNESDDPLVLTGDAMVQEDVLQQAEQSNNQGSWIAVHMCRWTLSLFFCDWELAQICAATVSSKSMFARSHFTCLDFVVFVGLTAIVSAKARRRRVPRRAKTAMQSLRRWYHDGKVDALPPLLLLEAECANMRKKTNQSALEDLYRKAAEAATSRVSLRAIILERCAHVLNARGAPKSRVRDILLEAQEAYEEWGALAKVIHVEEAIESLYGKARSGAGAPRARQNSDGV